LPNVGPYIYDVSFLALLGAPYIYDISSLRVNALLLQQWSSERASMFRYEYIAYLVEKIDQVPFKHYLYPKQEGRKGSRLETVRKKIEVKQLSPNSR